MNVASGLGVGFDPPQQVRQLGDVGGDAPSLVAGQQVSRAVRRSDISRSGRISGSARLALETTLMTLTGSRVCIAAVGPNWRAAQRKVSRKIVQLLGSDPTHAARHATR
jgi:hypothetical protein